MQSSHFVNMTSVFRAPLKQVLRPQAVKYCFQKCLRYSYVSHTHTSTIRGNDLIQSIKSYTDHETAGCEKNWDKLESIMNEIRNIDPKAADIELATNCYQFITKYCKRNQPLNPTLINMQQTKIDNSEDAKLAYLFYETAIDLGCEEERKLKKMNMNALKHKIAFGCLINDDKFKLKWDLSPTLLLSLDYEQDLYYNTDFFVDLYYMMIVDGSWSLMPKFQEIVHSFSTSSKHQELNNSLNYISDEFYFKAIERGKNRVTQDSNYNYKIDGLLLLCLLHKIMYAAITNNRQWFEEAMIEILNDHITELDSKLFVDLYYMTVWNGVWNLLPQFQKLVKTKMTVNGVEEYKDEHLWRVTQNVYDVYKDINFDIPDTDWKFKGCDKNILFTGSKYYLENPQREIYSRGKLKIDTVKYSCSEFLDKHMKQWMKMDYNGKIINNKIITGAKE